MSNLCELEVCHSRGLRRDILFVDLMYWRRDCNSTNKMIFELDQSE